jgi:small subunit ribosomal protein S20
MAVEIIGGTNLANIQSQIKRNRQNEKRRLRNRDTRGAARSAVKTAFTTLTAGEDSKASVAAAIVALDKAARKGSIHHRNAARRKSRLMKRLNAAGQGAPAMPTPKVVEPKPVPAAKTAAEPKAKKTATKAAAKKAPAKKSTKNK